MKCILLAGLTFTATLLCPTSGTHAQVGREKGEAFLIQNEKKEGVKTLPSGLQYRVLKEGDGKHPTKADQVVVHYRGTLIDGTEFDSS
jgi:FKBP-type peptidyl-prolyl cis-trans isomerase